MRRTIASPRAPKAIGPYSQAVSVGDLVFLSGQIPLLRPGTNVLAIHGLNLAAGDSDFLLEPQLLATLTSVTSGYFSPGTPGTMRCKVRAALART